MRALALGVSMLLAASTASAQVISTDADGSTRDYDEDKEQYSEFWERALSPAAGTYEDLVAQAQGIINSLGSRKAGVGEARTLLGDAIAARPDAPLAHFWLGVLENRAGNHAACAAALGRAVAVDPSFTAPVAGPGLKKQWTLDYQLALCQALAGELGPAAQRFHRITSKHPSCGDSRTKDCYGWRVPYRLGETLMALGRLEEAIEALRTAVGIRGGDLAARYSLAVALERDERVSEANRLLDSVTNGDYRLRSLFAANKRYIPASDEYYYRGLARAFKGQAFRARIMFRAYLAKAPKSPWRSRAKTHLAKVANAPIGDGATLTGTIDRVKGVRAVRAAADRFLACVDDVPSQLFEVRIRMRLSATTTKASRAKTTRTVSVQHYDLLNVQHKSTKIIEVTRCLRKVGGEIPMPGFAGTVGSDASIRFQVAK